MIHHALRHFRGLRNHHHYLFIDRTQQYNNAAFVGKIVRLKTYLINAFRPIRTRVSEMEIYGVTAWVYSNNLSFITTLASTSSPRRPLHVMIPDIPHVNVYSFFHHRLKPIAYSQISTFSAYLRF